MTVLAHLEPLERALASKGFPAISPWWRATIERFYRDDRHQLVLRVGRRGGKSSTLCRIAVIEALYGEHVIPPGDLGIVAIVSVSRDEANQRLRTVKAILDAIGVKYKPIEGGIELLDRPIAFKVFTATIAGVSGFTCIAAVCDEVSKWRDADTGANPAQEVLASLRPTMATQPNAKIFLSSSPLGRDDAHALAFDAGDTSHQSVAHAPTWIANPTVSEARTHDLEPNERIWKREYAAIPQASVTSVFDADAVDAAMEHGSKLATVEGQAESVLIIDASRGGDAFTYGIARWALIDKKPKLWLSEIGEVPNAKDTASSVRWLTARAKANGAQLVAADQYEAQALFAMFGEAGLMFAEHKWTAPAKQRAVDRIDRWLRDEELLLCESDKLRKQLHEYSERITKTGEITYGGRGRHDDYAAIMVTLAMADEALRVPMVYAPVVETKPAFGTREYADEQQRIMWEGAKRQHQENEALTEAIERDGGFWGGDE